MKRFALLALAFMAAMIAVALVGPLIAIQCNLHRTGHAKEMLLASMKGRFPHLQCSGGNGYLPSLSITVAGRIEPEEQIRVRDFLRAEKSIILPDVISSLEFRDIIDPETLCAKSHEF